MKLNYSTKLKEPHLLRLHPFLFCDCVTKQQMSFPASFIPQLLFMDCCFPFLSCFLFCFSSVCFIFSRHVKRS